MMDRGRRKTHQSGKMELKIVGVNAGKTNRLRERCDVHGKRSICRKFSPKEKPIWKNVFGLDTVETN